jgi:hypothetical protein
MKILTLHRYVIPVRSTLIVLGLIAINLTACTPTPPPSVVNTATETTVLPTSPPEPTHTVIQPSDLPASATPASASPTPEAGNAPFPTTIWQMADSKWETSSTRWEGNQLCESDPSQSYGKAESELITLDVAEYPLLYVNATVVDPGSRYKIQLLDKSNNQATDVLAQGEAGSQTINLAELMEWSGELHFTLNIWIEGESKCTTFENIALGTNSPTELPASVTPASASPTLPTGEVSLPITFWQMATSKWETTSTQWQGNRLCEADPSQSYGKAESEVITLDVDTYPLLYVNASVVDPDSRYKIQLLDKSNDQAADILAQGEAGSQTINLAELTGWKGEVHFTLNIWIEGESKCTTFENIALGAE